MSATVEYPLVPDSEDQLQAGQFWSIPLRNGSYGCGVVVELDKKSGVAFFHGVLLDWRDSTPPTQAVVISSTEILAKSFCGAAAITVGGGRIEGRVEVERLAIELPEEIDSVAGHNRKVFQGSTIVRDASADDLRQLQTRGMGSMGSFRVAAERRLVTTRRFIVLWPPEVNYGKLAAAFEGLDEENETARLGPLGGDKVFYNQPKIERFLGADWYQGPAASYLAKGFVPWVFDFAPGSPLFRKSANAMTSLASGYVDNGIDPIMSTADFVTAYPADQPWPFAD